MSDSEKKEIRVWCDGWYVLNSNKINRFSFFDRNKFGVFSDKCFDWFYCNEVLVENSYFCGGNHPIMDYGN